MGVGEGGGMVRVGVACDRYEAQTKCDAKAAYKTTKCYGHLFAQCSEEREREGERQQERERVAARQNVAIFPRGSHFEVFGRRCGFSGLRLCQGLQWSCICGGDTQRAGLAGTR